MKRIIASIILSIIPVITLNACSPKPPTLTKYGESTVLMGTTVELDVCFNDSQRQDLERIFEMVWDRLEDIAWRMSVYEDSSDVSKINRAFKEPVQVGEDTYQLIKRAFALHQRSFATFDITVYPLVQLWERQAELNKFPTRKELVEAKQITGVSKIKLMGDNNIKVQTRGVSIDLGGIAKGYAIDEAARIFRENGIKNFMVDAGGDLYVGGYNCTGKPWRIGIKDPRNPKEVLDILEVTDSAIATSGDYQQFFEIRGQRFSHIINPITGYPQRGVVSATVVGPNATEADALATALCILDEERGKRVVNGLGDGWASLVMSERKAKFRQIESKRYRGFRAKPLRF